MSVTLPETTDAFGKISIAVIVAKPASLTAVSLATDLTGAAAENGSCHIVGDWLPTASIEKNARARKLCQVKQGTALGVAQWDTPTIQYTANPQSVGTPGADGNELYEAMPEGAERYVLLRLGLDGDSALAVGDKYLLIPAELGPQVWTTTTQDAGAEFAINQDMAFLAGYDAPINGVIVA